MRRSLLQGSTLFGLVLGALALVALTRVAHLGQAVALLRSVGAPLTWLALPYALATGLYAVPWGLLLHRKDRPRWGAVVGGRFAAAAVNVVLPSGVFGEPVRLRAVQPQSRRLASEALVWDRALYLLASGGFLAIALWGGHKPGGPAFVAAAGAAVVGYLWGGAGLLGATQIPFVRRLIGGWVDRFFAKHKKHHAPALKPALSTAVGCFLLHLGARLVMAGELWLGASLLGVHLSFAHWMLAAGALALSAAAFPIVPGQLGVQEAALAGAMVAMGLDSSLGVALAMMVRLRQAFFVPLGLALAASPWTAVTREREPVRESA